MSTSTTDTIDHRELGEYAKKSYRYLRIGLIVVLLALLSAVVIERTHAAGWEQSISAYFYTPVHSVFVGALVALGVCLVAIHGNTDVEDVLLNVGGALAPIVAFVPTSVPSPLQTKHPYAAGDPLPGIKNNLVALAIALVLALVIGVVTIARADRRRRPTIDKNAAVGLALTAVLLAVGIGWYATSRKTFLAHAHGGGAAVLFGLVGVVVLLNGLGSPNAKYRNGYRTVAGAMALGALSLTIAGWAAKGWRHQVLWLELIELTLLLAFWTMQTAELWDAGVPTSSARAQRTPSMRASARRGASDPPSVTTAGGS